MRERVYDALKPIYLAAVNKALIDAGFPEIGQWRLRVVDLVKELCSITEDTINAEVSA